MPVSLRKQVLHYETQGFSNLRYGVWIIGLIPWRTSAGLWITLPFVISDGSRLDSLNKGAGLP